MSEITISTYRDLEVVRKYDQHSAPFWGHFPHQILREFKRSVPWQLDSNGHPYKLALDLGSASGHGAQRLKQFGLNVVCLDISHPFLQMCKEKNFPSLEADMRKIPLADNSVGGVWAFKSLVHIPRFGMPKALHEVRRILKDDGVFALSVIQGEGERISKINGLPRETTYYEIQDVREILKENGFNYFFARAQIWGRRGTIYLTFLARKTH